MSDKKAIIYSSCAPDKSQTKKFLKFLKEKYNEDIELEFQQSDAFPGGFRLEVGNDLYDYSVNGRFKQLKDTLVSVPKSNGNIIPLLKQAIDNFEATAVKREVGSVISVIDGIADIKGLDNASYGEIIVFSSGAKGMVQNICPDKISCILFSEDGDISQGSSCYRSYKTAGMPVGDAFLGRVVNALGEPIDGNGEIKADDYYPLETPAPSIIDRKSVCRPLETGILTIDSMFPIGRGQRELIIGDRQTGKTAIAIDTILNQKGKNVICIYVAIGQKASSVALLVETLRKKGALDYSIIVSAFASDSSSIQYISPYAGCALGEYFMKHGKDVLIIYDDLSKHAISYRTISLLLGRSPGREAYPGDVFYLHSRLLERAAQLSDELGGGSMTALPIVETQASDVSAYIPTNIISITDGQLFLESDLFFAGQRPAINIGLSVSRVGGDAQTKAMKKASGTLRLDLSQYREMEVFTQFASDLDTTTRQLLEYGKSLMQVLRQPQYNPLKQYEEVITLVCALQRLFTKVPFAKIKDFQKNLLISFMKEKAILCNKIENEKLLTMEIKDEILAYANEYLEKYLQSEV